MKGTPESVSAAEAATIDDVGVVLQVVGEHGHDDLGVVLVALGEERADRAVDQAGDQGLLLRRTAFALEVAAGDTAGGVGPLLVVDREREEVAPGLGLLLGDDGGEDGGLAVGGDVATYGETVVLATVVSAKSRSPASTSSRSRSTTRRRPTPPAASPAATSSAKAVRARRRR